MSDDSPALDAANIALAEAKTAESQAERRRIDLDAARIQQELDDDADRYARRNRDEAIEDANNIDLQHIYYFNDTVSGASVALCRRKLNLWHTIAPGCNIEVAFNSPGGSVFDGFDLYDAIRDTSNQGHHITTRVAGLAASMAGVLLQAGDTRIIGNRSYLHLHEVSTGALGKASDLKDVADLAKRLTRDACDIYAERSTLSSDDIYDRMERQELYLSAHQALELGFVDLVA